MHGRIRAVDLRGERVRTSRPRRRAGIRARHGHHPAPGLQSRPPALPGPCDARRPARRHCSGRFDDPPPRRGGPAPRNLRGTAWKVESRGSTGVQVFLFCNSGRWEIVGSQLFNGGVSPVGTYTQAGSRLTTRNQDDGTVQPWTLTWPGGDRLDANDGQVTLRLHYNGRASC